MASKLIDSVSAEQEQSWATVFMEEVDEKFLSWIADKELYSYSFKFDRRYFFYRCTTVKLWALMFETKDGEEVTLGYAYTNGDMLQLVRAYVEDVEKFDSSLLKEMLQELPELV